MIKIKGFNKPSIYKRKPDTNHRIDLEERKEGMKISLLYDPMFKTMMMNENRLKYSCKLFSYFLDVSYTTLLKNLRLGKNELDKHKEKSKGERADYVAVIKGTYLNLEINNNDEPYVMERNQEYAHRLFSKKNERGPHYTYTQVIQISINNFAFEGRDEVFNIHCDQDSYGEVYNDKIIFIEIYIPNLRKKWYNKEELSEVERYLLALVETDISTSLELGKGDKVMNDYINESIEVTDDDFFGESYDKELAWREQMKCDAAREYRQQGIEEGIKEGIEKGIEQGIEKGIEQGIKQGIEQGIEQDRKEMINRLNTKLDIDTIVDLTGLTKEKVEEYLKDNS